MNDQERSRLLSTMTVIPCEIAGLSIPLSPKQFSSGSLGWHGNGKLPVQGTRVQVNIILTVIGSKPGTPEQEESPKIDSKAPGSPVELFGSENGPYDVEVPRKGKKGPSRGRKGGS